MLAQPGKMLYGIIDGRKGEVLWPNPIGRLSQETPLTRISWDSLKSQEKKKKENQGAVSGSILEGGSQGTPAASAGGK